MMVAEFLDLRYNVYYYNKIERCIQATSGCFDNVSF